MEHPLPAVRSAWWSRFVGTVGLGLALVGLVTADVSKIDNLGLLRVPSPMYYLGIGLVLVGAVSEVACQRTNTTWFGLHLVWLAILLHGLPGILEANPRFPVAYVHVGFAEQIATNGALLPSLDARWSWPSFFAGAALIQEATGGDKVLWLVRYTPVIINLTAAAAILVLGRICSVSPQRCRTAALLFLLLNWVGQDYFAPQAIGFLIYLAIVCCVLLIYPGTQASSGAPARWLHPRPVIRIEAPEKVQRIGLFVLTLAIGVLVTSHQLTPGFLATALILLAVVNATRLRALGFVVIAMTAGWLSYAAEAYWRGNSETLFSSVGDVTVLVQENIVQRTGGGAGRFPVVAARIGLAGLVAVAVLLALVILWRRKTLPVALAALVVAPAPLLLAQAYGGEMILRVFFFTLPAASLLIADIVGADALWSPRRQTLVTAALVAIVPLFILARFGNESFEQVSTPDRAVLTTLYEVAPDDTTVYLLNSISVQGLERVDEVRFRALSSNDTAEEIVARLTDESGLVTQFIMVTDAQEEQGVQQGGQRPGWSGRLVDELLQSGAFAAVERQGDAALLRYVQP